jgi:hypothetical protein
MGQVIKMSLIKPVIDFIIAGGLIAFVIELGVIFGPALAGIVAALPLRVWATLLVGAASGTEFVSSLVYGMVPAGIGAIAFTYALVLSLDRLGIWKSFALSWVVCICVSFPLLLVIL